MKPAQVMLFGVVRGCPLRTGPDRCEWHASGMAAEDDTGIGLGLWFHPDPTVRSVLGDHRLMGKSPEGSRQLGSQALSGTAGENDVAALGGDGFRLGRRVRPVVGNEHLWARARSARSGLEMRLERKPASLHPVA
jgi:hypothetical protein